DQHGPNIRIRIAQHDARRTLDRGAPVRDERPGEERRRRRLGEARGEGLHRVVRLLAARVEIVEHIGLARRAGMLRGNCRRREKETRADRADRGRDREAAGWNAHDSNGNVRRVQPSVRVSGIGIVSPFGTSHDAFRDALVEGRGGIATIGGFDTAGLRSTLGAEVRDFDAARWVPPMKMRRMDRTAVYAVAATKLAAEDAGISIAADGDDDGGVMLGTWTAGGGSTQVFLDALFKSGPSGAPALLFDSTVANSAAAVAGLELRLRGPNTTISQKEASGLAAVAGGVDLIRERRARSLVAGGADAVFETFYKAHERFRVMSAERAFSRRHAPFDAERGGFVLGEGAYELWLERSAAGHEAGGHGEILGVGASSALVPINAWPNRPDALVRTMRLALADAGLDAHAVDVVYASANATRELDAAEA